MNTKLFLKYPTLKGWIKKNKDEVSKMEFFIYSSKYQSAKLRIKVPYKPL